MNVARRACGERSTTTGLLRVGIKRFRNGKPSLLRGGDIVWPVWRHAAGVIAHRVGSCALTGQAFDGDALNGIWLIEGDAARAYHVLHPSQRIKSTNQSSISDDITLPKQSIAVLNNYLQSVD